MKTIEEKLEAGTTEKPKAKKVATPKATRPEGNDAQEILPLTALETKAVTIDAKFAAILEEKAAQLNSGRRFRKVQPSDVLAHLAIKVGPDGLKFNRERSEKVEKSYTLPEISWHYLSQLAERNKATLEETVEELIRAYSYSGQS